MLGVIGSELGVAGNNLSALSNEETIEAGESIDEYEKMEPPLVRSLAEPRGEEGNIEVDEAEEGADGKAQRALAFDRDVDKAEGRREWLEEGKGRENCCVGE